MEFTELITRRETVRKFDGRKPSEAQLQQILEAGRLAPTARNQQPQRVYVLESEEALKRMDQASPCRYGAPLALLVCADKEAALAVNGQSSYAVDASIAATHMLLAALDAGVDSAWIGVFDPEKIRRIFGLPEKIVPVCFLDLGFRAGDYPGNPTHTQRNSLEEMVTRL